MSTQTTTYQMNDDDGYTVTRYTFTAATEVDEDGDAWTTWTVTQYGDQVAEGECEGDSNAAETEAWAALAAKRNDGGAYYRQVCSDYYTDRI